jgi:hypothetical protein
MKRYLGTTLWACAILLLWSWPAFAIIRLNGNQMVEGAKTYGSDLKARGASGSSIQAGAPTRLVTSLGQGIMARGELPDSLVGQEGKVAVFIGMGLGYDIANVVYQVFCPIGYTGDINDNGALNTEDIIMLATTSSRAGSLQSPARRPGT